VSATPNDIEVDSALFTANVTSLTHSFGDNTRRKIYFFVRENPGATASDLSSHCHVHANVVRHHLERLTEGGYVTFDNVRKSTVGRPAKGYRAVDDTLVMDGSMRRDVLLVALLELALERLGPDAAEQLAHEVGVDYGHTLGESVVPTDASRPVKAAMTSIAGLLTAHGFAAHAEDHDSEQCVIAENCPFGSTARHHPVLCAVDRGLISGMLEGLGAERTTVTLTPRAHGDEGCRLTV
jgi:predicted ArsR family transcriptional regulator